MILLDTHVVLWLAFEPDRLSKNAVNAIQEARRNGDGLAISGVTLYELASLSARGRIQLEISTEKLVQEVEAQFVVKPITSRVCVEAQRLQATYPKDPMDRVIGGTAIAEDMPLITADGVIRKSKAVRTIW
jgi:PIN domain nuclease of toxin-antitoxin system